VVEFESMREFLGLGELERAGEFELIGAASDGGGPMHFEKALELPMDTRTNRARGEFAFVARRLHGHDHFGFHLHDLAGCLFRDLPPPRFLMP
jgi:hypothetical protein